MAILLLPPPRDQHGNQDDGDGNQHPVLERRTNEHEVLCQPSAQPRSGMTLPPLVAITAPTYSPWQRLWLLFCWVGRGNTPLVISTAQKYQRLKSR